MNPEGTYSYTGIGEPTMRVRRCYVCSRDRDCRPLHDKREVCGECVAIIAQPIAANRSGR
jgi:hypothetical protein